MIHLLCIDLTSFVVDTGSLELYKVLSMYYIDLVFS